MNAPPISVELWARLKSLDPQCSISMCRREPYRVEWRGHRRTWHVSVRHDLAMYHDSVNVEHPTLAAALVSAIEMAEAKGWQRRDL